MGIISWIHAVSVALKAAARRAPASRAALRPGAG